MLDSPGAKKMSPCTQPMPDFSLDRLASGGVRSISGEEKSGRKMFCMYVC